MEDRDWHTEPLDVLGLSVRPFRCLASRGIRTVGQLCCMPVDELCSGQSWGVTTLNDARAKLAPFGLRLWDDWQATLIDELGLSPRARGLMAELRVTKMGELLRLSTEDLYRLSFCQTAVRDVYRALGLRALRLRDGWPRGPEDWREPTG